MSAAEPKVDPLDRFAPLPTPDTPGYAEAFLRYSLVRARAAEALIGVDPAGDRPHADRFARHFATAYLLRALQVADSLPDATAARLVAFLHAPEDASVLVATWLQDRGLDPASITATAQAAAVVRRAELAARDLQATAPAGDPPLPLTRAPLDAVREWHANATAVPATEWDEGEYIRTRYQVPAYIAGRVRIDGSEGRILGFDRENHELVVTFDGQRHPQCCHPTWRVTYLDTPPAAG